MYFSSPLTPPAPLRSVNDLVMDRTSTLRAGHSTHRLFCAVPVKDAGTDPDARSSVGACLRPIDARPLFGEAVEDVMIEWIGGERGKPVDRWFQGHTVEGQMYRRILVNLLTHREVPGPRAMALYEKLGFRQYLC